MKFLKTFCISAFSAALLLAPFTTVSAVSQLQQEDTYYNYNYNSKGQAVSGPAGYEPQKPITVIEGAGNLSKPTDMYVTANQNVCVLDAGNDRLLWLDRDLSLFGVINPADENGDLISIQNATGIFVKPNGDLLVSDPKMQVVHILNEQGVRIGTLDAPESDVLPDGFNFVPQRVVCDDYGVYYILSKGSYNGILQYKSDKSFMGFFGAEKVNVTAALVMDRFWKNLLSRTQADSMKKYVPVEYTSIDIDNNGFIYGVKNDFDGTFTGQLERLNPLGENVLWYQGRGGVRRYGEMEVVYSPQNGFLDSQFVDVAYDDAGFINLLDRRKGRIYQYDLSANLIFAFGGLGSEQGTATSPVAIEVLNDKILVLDNAGNSINVFTRTAYGSLYHEGVSLLQRGENSEAFGIWENILKTNTFDEIANLGMGKALAVQGKYSESLKYFERAGSRENYSEAFKDYRSELLVKFFPLILLAIVLLLAVPFVLSAVKKRRKVTSEYNTRISARAMPLYSMRHPFKAYTMLKEEKQGSIMFALLIVAGFFVTSVINRQGTGFLFNHNDLEQFNVFYSFFSTVGLFVFFVVANWAVSTLMDGEGKFKEICIFVGYAMLPLVLFAIPLVLASHVLSLDESAFLSIAQNLMYVWTGLAIVMAVKEVHQFTLKKCIFSLILTVVGMIMIVTIAAIIYSVVIRLFGFAGDIFTEISLR